MFDLLWSGAGTRKRWAGVGWRVWQPSEVVEAALQVPALLPGAALVAEVGVGQRIVVERRDAGAANLAEERGSLERLDRDQLAIGALGHPVAAGRAVEGGDSVDENLLLARIGRSLVQGFHHHGVDGVFHGVVRVEVAGKPEQRPPCRFIERRELERPDLAWREERDRTGREHQGPDEDTGALLQELPARWRSGLHGSSFAPEGLHARPSRSSFSSAPRGCCALGRRYKVESAPLSITETPKPPSPDERCQQPVHRAGRFHLHHVSPIGEHLDLHARRETGRVRGRDDPILRPPDDERGNVRRRKHVVEEPPLRAAGEEVVRELAERGIDSLESLYFRRLSTSWRVTSLSSA